MDSNPILSAEEEAAGQYNLTRKVTRMALRDDTEDFVVFDQSGQRKAEFKLGGVDCPWKRLIFRALKAAYNQIFIHENTAESNKSTFLIHAQGFWSFVKVYPTSKILWRVRIIKNYEAFKIDAEKVKSHSSGLIEIKRFINIALSSIDFYKALSAVERDYLYTITDVKATYP